MQYVLSEHMDVRAIVSIRVRSVTHGVHTARSWGDTAINFFQNFVAIFLPPQFRDFHRLWKTYTTGHWKWLSIRQPARSCLLFSHPKQTHSHGSRHIIQGWGDAKHFLLLRTTNQPDINVPKLLSPNRKFISNCETLSILTNALRRME